MQIPYKRCVHMMTDAQMRAQMVSLCTQLLQSMVLLRVVYMETQSTHCHRGVDVPISCYNGSPSHCTFGLPFHPPPHFIFVSSHFVWMPPFPDMTVHSPHSHPHRTLLSSLFSLHSSLHSLLSTASSSNLFYTLCSITPSHALPLLSPPSLLSCTPKN